MIRPLVPLSVFGFALALVGCQPAGNGQDNDAINAAQDAAAGPVGAGSAATLGNTLEGYVSNAAEGDMYEIQAATIALERTGDADVRALAEMIRSDHTAASERFLPLARAAGQTIPAELDERRQGLLDNLRGADNDAFDRVWLEQQVAAHNEALALHRAFADNQEYRDLAAHAQGVVGPVQRHLERAEALLEARD